jgi:pimeloyl-ACP methyl ester carboxylesterase
MLAGCGKSESYRAPALLDGCAARTPRDAVAAGEQIPLVMLGKGSETVVLSNESDEDLCSWLGFARRLAAAGYLVVLWDYGGDPPVTELIAVVAALRAAGDGPIILMGASEGAKASLVAAVQIRPAPLAVVSLSAEAALRGTPVAPTVRHLPCPALLVTSANDPYGSAPAAATFMAEAPRGRAVLYAIPGDAHGTALLTGTVDTRITRFLAGVTPKVDHGEWVVDHTLFWSTTHSP